MLIRHLALPIALLGGCGLEPDPFASEYPAAFCRWTEECAYSNVDADPEGPDAVDDATTAACEESMALLLDDAAQNPDCAYDGGQARQCLKALEGSCEDRTAVYYECKRVYSGDDCASDLSSSE